MLIVVRVASAFCSESVGGVGEGNTDVWEEIGYSVAHIGSARVVLTCSGCVVEDGMAGSTVSSPEEVSSPKNCWRCSLQKDVLQQIFIFLFRSSGTHGLLGFEQPLLYE